MQYSPQISAEANATRALARGIVVIGYHLLLWAFAFQLAMALRFEGDVPRPWSSRRWPVLGILIGIRLVTFYRAGLFHGLWRRVIDGGRVLADARLWRVAKKTKRNAGR